MLTRGLGTGGMVTGGMGAYGRAAPPGPPPGPPMGRRVAGTGRYIPEEFPLAVTAERLVAEDEEILLLIT